jgi:hypothetical protein
MASKKNLRKLRPRGRKARFAEYARRTRTAVGQWSKGRFRSPYLDQKIREWNPEAAQEATPAPIQAEQQKPIATDPHPKSAAAA